MTDAIREALEFRKSRAEDIPRMLEIFARARRFMDETGNTTQWTTADRPREEMLLNDIALDRSYVCLCEGRIVGTFVYMYGDDPEPGYGADRITDGGWKDPSPYGVIHRIASSGEMKGIGVACIEWCAAQCPHIRIDTHPNNRPMHGLLGKLGFVRCGTISVPVDDGVRVIYERSESVHA